MATAHPKSKKFAELSAAERARRIKGIKDPKKRSAAARFWDVDLGRSEWHPVESKKYRPANPKKESGNFWERAWEDVPKMFHGAVKEGKELGGGIRKDIELGRGLPGAVRFGIQRTSPLAPTSLLLEQLDVIEGPKGPWDYKKLPKDQQRGALDKWGEKTIKSYPGQLKMLADPMGWYNDPLIQAATLGSLVLPGLRVASVARLSSKFAKANPGMTKTQANKAAIVESYRPGLMATNGVKGGIERKVVKGKYGDAPGRMPSRGPLGRGGQAAWYAGLEAIDRRNPNAPFSASRRNAAITRKQADRQTKREAAAQKRNLDIVTAALTPSRGQRAKQALGLAGRVDPAVAQALIASLEGPKGISVAKAAELKAAAKTKILEEDTELRTKQDAIDEIQAQRDAADAERQRAAEEAEIEGDEFDPTPHDEAIAALDGEIKNRTDQLDFDLARKVPEVSGSKARDSIYAAMKRSLGPEEARQTIIPFDALARARNPENPAAAYDLMFEGARVMKHDEFGAGEGGRVLYRRSPEAAQGAIPQSEMGFVSTLVETVLKQDPEKVVQSGKMRSILEKAGVSPVEMRNAGLEDLLQSKPSLTAQEVVDHLVGRAYFNTFNPHVEIRSDYLANPVEGGYGAVPGPDRVEYGPYSMPELNSRHGQPGEYHEMTVSLPEHWSGSDTSHGHFGDPRVVYHVRYQIFTDEDGNRVMLIDEIQSDWASDFRKKKREGKHEREPGEGSGLPPLEELRQQQAQLRDLREYLEEERAELDDQSKKILHAVRDGIDEQDEDFLEALDRERDLKDNVASYEAQIRAIESGNASAKQEIVVKLTNDWNRARNEYSDTMGRFERLEEELGADHPDTKAAEKLARAAHKRLRDTSRELNKAGGPTLQSRSPMGLDEKYLKNAIHTIMRVADDEDVDYIVLSDGTTQALRNDKAEMGVDEGVTYPRSKWDRDDSMDEEDWRDEPEQEIDLPGDYEASFAQAIDDDYGHWLDSETGKPLTNEEIHAILKKQAETLDEKGNSMLGSFPRLYNKTIPNLFKKLYGVESEHMADAYTGHYSAQTGRYDTSSWDGYLVKEDSGMPGTVIRMTDEAREKARQDAPMYRRNMEGVPQGATEFLADGRARLTMFETANVSTWIHELAHVAVKDLDPAERKVLEDHLADGKPFEEWDEADNEAYARSFETYFRTGKAAPALAEIFDKITAWMKRLWHEIGPEGEQIAPEVADVYDRMLGRRYQNTVLLDKRQRGQVESEIKDLRSALERPDDLDAAGEALATLAEKAEEAGLEIMKRNAKSPAQLAALVEGLARRKNAVIEDYRRRGLIGHGEDARGYFPNMSMWEALGQPQVAPSRVAATGSVIGTPRVTSKAVNKNRNRLIRYQTGEVLADPNAVLYVLRARQRILETIRAREELYAVGEPIHEAMAAPGWNPDEFALVRNPDVMPEKMRHATEAMANLSREDYTRLQKRGMVQDADELDVSDITEEMIWIPGEGKPKPEWVHTEDNVRAVPMKVAKNRVGDVFTSKPRGNAAAVLGMTNALARAASIYLPLGGARYIARNWIQNGVLMAITQPSAFGHLITAKGRALYKRDPVLFNRLNEEFGTIQAQALPEFNTRPQGRMQRWERDMNRMSGQAGEHLGRFADVPMRLASIRRHASKYGLDTDADLYRMLDDPDLEFVRDTVSQRVREDMIDFDTLTPFEKEVLSRYLFIWPFVRGAVKWPFMYAREYPGRLAATAILSDAANQEDQSGGLSDQLKTLVDVPFIGKRQFDFQWMNPIGPLLDQVQNMDEFIKRNARGEITLKPIITEQLAPQYKFLLDALTGDLGNDPAQKLLSTFAPMFTTAEAATGGLDDLREFVLKTFGNQTDSRSIKKEAGDWAKEMDDAIAFVKKEKGVELRPEILAKVEIAKAAYGDWTTLSKRAEWEKAEQGVDKLPPQERAAMALEVLHEHYPEAYAQAAEECRANTGLSPEEFIATQTDDEKLDKIYQAIRDQMFGIKEEVMSGAKDAGYKK